MSAHVSFTWYTYDHALSHLTHVEIVSTVLSEIFPDNDAALP